MKIKINNITEAILVVAAFVLAAIATYTETSRLTGHFMQRQSVTVVSMAITTPSPTTTTVTTSVAPKPLERRTVAVRTSLREVESKRLLRAAPEQPDSFPAFGKAIYPVKKAPNWGVMTTPEQWERIYAEMNSEDFVSIPAYDVSRLTIPMRELTRNRTNENNALITEKLFYSTRYFGAYDLDSGEHQGRHVGIDFKLAAGTPIGSVAGGVVHATGNNDDLGNYVMVLHRLPGTGEEVVSVYGHLDTVTVIEGATVAPGTTIGYAGSTGKSLSPHLHLQIDYKKSPGRHVVYVPGSDVSVEEVSKWTLHPIEFIANW